MHEGHYGDRFVSYFAYLALLFSTVMLCVYSEVVQ
jgi:hypothetical protein